MKWLYSGSHNFGFCSNKNELKLLKENSFFCCCSRRGSQSRRWPIFNSFVQMSKHQHLFFFIRFIETQNIINISSSSSVSLYLQHQHFFIFIRFIETQTSAFIIQTLHWNLNIKISLLHTFHWSLKHQHFFFVRFIETKKTLSSYY